MPHKCHKGLVATGRFDMDVGVGAGQGELCCKRPVSTRASGLSQVKAQGGARHVGSGPGLCDKSHVHLPQWHIRACPSRARPRAHPGYGSPGLGAPSQEVPSQHPWQGSGTEMDPKPPWPCPAHVQNGMHGVEGAGPHGRTLTLGSWGTGPNPNSVTQQLGQTTRAPGSGGAGQGWGLRDAESHGAGHSQSTDGSPFLFTSLSPCSQEATHNSIDDGSRLSPSTNPGPTQL